MEHPRQAHVLSPWAPALSNDPSTWFGYVTTPTGTRQLVHLDRDGADRPLLGSGWPQTARELAGQGLVECIYPGCGSYSHARGGTKKHACFVHPRGHDTAAHPSAPESVDHILSKITLLDWIKETYKDHLLDWDLDSKNLFHRASSGNLQLRPDVYVAFKTGIRIAIEVQHSRPNIHRMIQKTQTYNAMGVTTWWLFSGQTEETFSDPKRVRPVEGIGSYTVALTTEQQFLTKNKIPFLWFNQPSREIATPIAWMKEYLTPGKKDTHNPCHPHDLGLFAFPPNPRTARAYACISELSACRICLQTGALLTPGTDRILRDGVRRTNAKAAARARIAWAQNAKKTETARKPPAIGPTESSPPTPPAPQLEEQPLGHTTTGPHMDTPPKQPPPSPPEAPILGSSSLESTRIPQPSTPQEPKASLFQRVMRALHNFLRS